MMMKRSYILYAILMLAISFLTTNAFAGHGYEFCSDNNSNYYSNGKRSEMKRELREMTIPAARFIEVDGQKNGGISVKGENRTDVLVRACINTWAESEQDALAALNNTRIETSGVIRATNPDESAKYSVSYELLVPTRIDLKLSAHNGGISIRSVDGNLQFETTNGGISLKDVAGDVKGRTSNGGVAVSLSGPGWMGTGLDVTTTNGGVKLVLPRTYAAEIETGTVNGGFSSDFPELNVERNDKNGWTRPKKVNANLNGGGAKIRVVTTNGGVKIASAEE